MNSLAEELRGNYARPCGMGRVIINLPEEIQIRRSRPAITAKRILHEDLFHKLHKAGMDIPEIARHTKFHRKTVARYLVTRKVRRAPRRKG